jgi:hypothetical protein
LGHIDSHTKIYLLPPMLELILSNDMFCVLGVGESECACVHVACSVVWLISRCIRYKPSTCACGGL